MSHTLTEGGQITSHRLRMFRQVIKVTILVSFFIGLCVFGYMMSKVSTLHYLGTWYYFNAWLMKGIVSEISVSHEFLLKASQTYYSADPYLPLEYVSKITKPFMNRLLEEAYLALLKSLLAVLFTFFSTIVFFLILGRKVKMEKHLSGTKISKLLWLRLRLKMSKKASTFHIGSLPLVKNTESRHMLITGGTGSGKTNCLHHLLKQIRKNGQKTIIVDTNGIFLEKYYREGKDVILNPFDPRSAPWNPWAEGESSFDYADIAESFIPHTNHDHENYWREASKALFVSLLEKFSDSKRSSELTRWLQYESLPNLCKFLQGTPAAAHMDLTSEKTASSIRSVAATFLSSIKSLEDTSTPFAIKDWLKSPDDSWLFLQTNTKQRAFLRPLISAWISSAIRGLLSLPVDLNRRVWFIIDELPSLQKVKDLDLLLTEGRKYGGCGVLVLQTPAQLEEIYGREVSQVIIANTATKVVFQEEDPVIAERISRSFGEKEITEKQEGISYGAHETRDSVSVSTVKKTKPIVTPTQILQLPVNTAFIKLPSGEGVAKVKLKVLR